jgi:hypothetical protein
VTVENEPVTKINMNLDNIKDFFGQFDIKDLPAGGAALLGIILLVLVFKTGKAFTRFLFFIIAVGLFAGAWWWHLHK